MLDLYEISGDHVIALQVQGNQVVAWLKILKYLLEPLSLHNQNRHPLKLWIFPQVFDDRVGGTPSPAFLNKDIPDFLQLASWRGTCCKWLDWIIERVVPDPRGH